jgi:hypothetical protein
MTPPRIAIPLQLSAPAARPVPVSLNLDAGALASAGAGRPARVVPSSARLRRGDGRHEALIEAHPLDGLGDDPRQPLCFCWLEGVDVHTAHSLEIDLAAEGEADAAPSPSPLTFPRVQLVPQPGRRIDGLVDGRAVLAYHYDPGAEKPFLHPLLGPAGVSLTRMGHPGDREGRVHQNGLWIAHRDVDGENFWDDRAADGRLCHGSIPRLEDGPVSARLTHVVSWESADGRPRLTEHREFRLFALPNAELMLDVTIELHALERPVRLGRTPFGLLGVRVNRTMAADRGGRVTATGASGEEQALHQRARWCDYSGPIAPGLWNGLAVFDHDANPHHPCCWQVRDDGWMGPAPCYESGLEIDPEGLLTFRYRLLAHDGDAGSAAVGARYDDYVEPPRLMAGAPRLVPAA